MVCLVPAIANCLTSLPAVIEEVNNARPIVGVMLILRGIDEFLARGVLTPLAKQAVIAITSIMSVYLVSVPLMTWFIYAYQANASWIFSTITLGCAIQSIVYIGRLCLLDLENEIDKSAERMALNRSSTTSTTPENKFIENGIQGQKNEGLELDDEHAPNREDIANRKEEMVDNLDKYVSD